MIMLYEKQKIILYKVSYLIENKTVIGEIESLTELSEYFIHQENNLIRKIKLISLSLSLSLSLSFVQIEQYRRESWVTWRRDASIETLWSN